MHNIHLYRYFIPKTKIFLILIFFLLKIQHGISIENKIEFKINNEIITSVDIVHEIKLLSSLNPKLQNLNKNQIYEVAKTH